MGPSEINCNSTSGNFDAIKITFQKWVGSNRQMQMKEDMLK